jgi:hypothetical protein
LLSGDPLPPTNDLVASRILWLDGLNEYKANTHDRFIYIHGTTHPGQNRQPGEPRMRANAQWGVIVVFDLVAEGARR